ncbi:DNA-3-methyladenine glycosylase, partial [Candidatus Saccharibacteria bacterium]|nr:DNA-3-methyladenine glycosylase [Candidatus Saccharibacteria bacterium]
QQNRGLIDTKNIANGPAKLAQALGIKDTGLSGKILNKSSILLTQPDSVLKADEIITAPRIGITKAANMPWRFYIKGNPFISRI